MAILILNKIIKSHPNHISSYLIRGKFLKILGYHKEALEDLKYATKYDTKFREDALNEKALVYQLLKMNEEEIETHYETLKFYPKNKFALLSLRKITKGKGMMLVEESKNKELKTLDSMYKIYPDTSVYFIKASIFYKMGIDAYPKKIEYIINAQNEINNYLTNKPDDITALYLKILILCNLHKFDEADKVFDKLHHLKPNSKKTKEIGNILKRFKEI